jgi:hypothetical protein
MSRAGFGSECNRIGRISVIASIVILVFCHVSGIQAEESAADFSQAEMVLDFLRSASTGKLDADLIDAIMAAEGTALIIEQQNRRARIDSSQYRRILETILDQDTPRIAPLDSTERAALGVRRLQNEVRMALRWGIENIGVLESELARLKEMEVSREARTIAETFLPSKLRSVPSILFVAGGRAGFFAADNYIYIDLIVASFSRIRRGEPFMNEQEITAYFAHEMHHVGFGGQMERLGATLVLDETGEMALGFVAGLVSEGSATYLISADRDIESMRTGRSYARYFAMGDTLLSLCDGILAGILNGEISNEDDYSLATRPLLGMGVHSAGSLMMYVIDCGSGLEAVMKVIEDPRLLLQEYERAAQTIQSDSGAEPVYRFDAEVVENFAEAVRIDKAR